MKFGSVALDQAEGAVLAHSVKCGQGYLKKGRRLSAADLEALRAAGHHSVVVARLEGGDVDEDAAAERIAAGILLPQIATENLRVVAAGTGRCNLVARRRGLLILDREAVTDLNQVSESVTLATLGPLEVVEQDQVVATIKIIPFAVPSQTLERCARIFEGRPDSSVLAVAPFTRKRVGFLQTVLPSTKQSVLDKSAEVLAARLAALDAVILTEKRCPHDEQAVADQFAALIESGSEIILIAGASAIMDRRDVLPAAVVRAGGDIEQLGMPAEPGNLIMVASLGAVPVVGMPGCARVPAFNGLDWVLRLLCAGRTVRAVDVMAMGVGGLLKKSFQRSSA